MLPIRSSSRIRLGSLFLETNLAIVIKIKSDRINREKLLFGIREDYGAQQRTDDEQIEALYQRLL